jgi:transmembrane sensor
LETYKKIAQLILKYQSNSLDEQERQTLQEWINRSERNRKLFKRLSSKRYWKKIRRINLEEQWRKVVQPYPVELVHKITSRRIYNIRKIAACILVPIGIGLLWFYLREDKKVQISEYNNSDFQHDSIRNPLLLLASGSIIELDKSATGPVANINGLEVRNGSRQVKFDFIPISYLPGYNKQGYAELFYKSANTIITPNGSTYFITLSDGTVVALNGNSTLKFPSQFDHDQREVELSGEAYFIVKPYYDEVARQKVPFIVKTNHMKVKVIGTEFNIKVYRNCDSIKTTLVKGVVEVMNDYSNCILRPGEEIVLNKNGEFSDPKNANVDEVIAWKVSAKFENAPIEEIMEHISRSFGVTVNYITKIPNRFNVYIPPTGSLAQALNYVRITGAVNFRVEGKNVFVTQ